MQPQTVTSLLKKVQSDYQTIATHFDQTRQIPWAEFADFLPYLKPKQKILDLGCGNGRLYQYLKKFRPDYLGIDNCQNFITSAQQNYPETKFDLQDLTKLQLTDKTYDLIFCVAAFHHLPSDKLQNDFLQNCYKALKIDGYLIMTNWNLFQPKYRFYLWQAILSKLTFRSPYGFCDCFIPWKNKDGQTIKRYYHAFTLTELKNLMRKNGFKLVKNYYCRQNKKANIFSGHNLITVGKK